MVMAIWQWLFGGGGLVKPPPWRFGITIMTAWQRFAPTTQRVKVNRKQKCIRWWSEDIKMHDDKDFELDNGILKIYDELKKMKITTCGMTLFAFNQWWNDYIQPTTKVGSWIDEDMKINDEPMKFQDSHSGSTPSVVTTDSRRNDKELVKSQLPGKVVYTTLLSMMCVKYSASVKRFVVDLLHVPPNGESSRPNVKEAVLVGVIGCFFYKIPLCTLNVNVRRSSELHQSFRICLRYGCWFGGKLIPKLRQKGVYEESFSRHAA
ncbi:hypothetical protein Tco_1193261 [Tanacetum coccineum]